MTRCFFRALEARPFPPRSVLAAAILLGWLALALRACNFRAESAARPNPAEIYAKVVRVDKASHEVEVKFLIPPKETRVVFSGDPGKILVGDFVKLDLNLTKTKIGGAEMKCQRVIWVLE